ncbi:hypothetical protein DFQ30_000182, partial [Apophysomyces sp. BC1015]
WEKESFDSVEQFPCTFQKVLKANDADLDRDWEKWLSLAIHNDHDSWFEGRLANRQYSWAKARKIFEQRFESPDRMIEMATRAYSMTMGNDESVLDYSTRFQKTCREGGIVDNEGLALRFLVSLLPHVRENVQVAWHGRHGKKPPQGVEEVLEVALAVSVQKRAYQQYMESSSSRPTARRRLENTWSDPTGSPLAGPKNASLGCAYHGPKACHSTAECKKHATNQGSSNAFNNNNNCTYYGQRYTTGHRCQEYRDAKAMKAKQNNLQLNAAFRSKQPTNHHADDAVENIADSLIDLEFESSSKYCQHGKRLSEQNPLQTKNPYSLYTPILLQDEQVLGLVDTGADFSAISIEWLKNKNLFQELIPVKGKIQFAGHGHHTDRFGITKPLQIRYNGRTFTHSFEVMKLQEGTDLLLGFDIMLKLGIALTGVAVNWDKMTLNLLQKLMMIFPKPNDSPAGTPAEHKTFPERHSTFHPGK